MGSLFTPVVRTIPFESPLFSFKRIYHGAPAFLLESARENPVTGRYSFLGTDPYRIFQSKGLEILIQNEDGFTEVLKSHPFAILQTFLDPFNVPRPEGFPPFFGGAVGYFGYDSARFFERLPRREKEDIPLPDCLLFFVDTVIVFDHLEKTGKIIYFPSPEDLAGQEWDRLQKKGEGKISSCMDRLRSPLSGSLFSESPSLPPVISPSISKIAFEEKVRQCREYIKAGDIFQANISQRFTVSGLNSGPLSLYEKLREINPASFSAFLDSGDFQLISSSPERLVSLSNGQLNTRPIAGTRPRGKNSGEDAAMRSALITSEKERAEHMMLIDLERNDLGKICDFGSIKVDEWMTLESYSHVIHIVSNILGRINPSRNWLDVLKAVFPGGTITGVPKIRAMEIIEELEPVRRGPYTGSLGYISFSGELDLNILIRTLVLIREKGFIQTGAGIVADSKPDREYEETLQKANALFKAVRHRP